MSETGPDARYGGTYPATLRGVLSQVREVNPTAAVLVYAEDPGEGYRLLCYLGTVLGQMDLFTDTGALSERGTSPRVVVSGPRPSLLRQREAQELAADLVLDVSRSGVKVARSKHTDRGFDYEVP